ncbi:hypothetical protein JX265_011202 [Neoarthrinium moseri]|uniref:Uncharacterized protein n=1 Tax=Neoarthrinium moseri TaxID=1658444 RepID=A0A9P9WD21_9PEZI|nr:hypothetical protein JX265_011202 [Neoarthrinium moseri]
MVDLKKLGIYLAALIPVVAALPAGTGSGSSPVDHYIVTMKRGMSDTEMATHISYAKDIHSRSVSRRGLSGLVEDGVRKEFHINEHRSYSGIFDTETINALRDHNSVASVDPVLDMHIWDTTKQLYAPWGLGSISHQISGTTNYVYEEDAQGDGYYAYVVDTGIRASHVDFGGRAVFGFSSVANETHDDLHGHGTHVAGTIGSATFGVAKKSTLVAVKVCNADGKTNTELIMAGLAWAYADMKNNTRIGKSVINMSLGGGRQPVLTEAVQALYKEGVTVVVAAGNEGSDAANYSPANAADAITVGAVDSTYTRAAFSNYGKNVDIFAPGESIMSLGFESDTATSVKSGTSMASPHVAGLVLYLKELHKIEKPDEVLARLESLAVKGIVEDTNGSANVLAFNGAVDGDTQLDISNIMRDAK